MLLRQTLAQQKSVFIEIRGLLIRFTLTEHLLFFVLIQMTTSIYR
ncbi:hypothetical protein JCM19232_4474 [Vibrio ishigakensis]|uniref:Uncharacterized protein n=1 Tax=Vibrio ishigakensis TaxID=1481914 RepID=A0A0B8PJD2_9VIBR|nr:hypothetical protein JCM19232_4474 [Vibrio ishigakensis]